MANLYQAHQPASSLEINHKSRSNPPEQRLQASKSIPPFYFEFIMSGTLNVPVYNDDTVALVVRSRDNSAQANQGRQLQPRESTTIALPRNDPYLIVVRTGQRDSAPKQ